VWNFVTLYLGISWHTHTQTTVLTVLWPLYRSTGVSQHPKLRSGGFCWSKVLLPAWLCWQQLAHSDYGKDAWVLNGAPCTISIPYLLGVLLKKLQMYFAVVHVTSSYICGWSVSRSSQDPEPGYFCHWCLLTPLTFTRFWLSGGLNSLSAVKLKLQFTFTSWLQLLFHNKFISCLFIFTILPYYKNNIIKSFRNMVIENLNGHFLLWQK